MEGGGEERRQNRADQLKLSYINRFYNVQVFLFFHTMLYTPSILLLLTTSVVFLSTYIWLNSYLDILEDLIMSKQLKPETLSSLFYANMFLIRGGRDPGKTYHKYQKWYADMTTINEPDIAFVNSNVFQVELTWYEDGEPPKLNDLCHIHGRLAFVGVDNEGCPLLKAFPFRVTR